jgi:hypothetical protein
VDSANRDFTAVIGEDEVACGEGLDGAEAGWSVNAGMAEEAALCHIGGVTDNIAYIGGLTTV